MIQSIQFANDPHRLEHANTKSITASGESDLKTILPVFNGIYDVSAITELGMANAVYETFAGCVHVLDETGDWLVTDSESGLWKRDMGGETVSAWFRQYLENGRSFAAQTVMNRGPSIIKLLPALQKLERYSAVHGAKEFLKSMSGITVTQAKFDTDPYIVGLKGGMCIDLRTGEVRKILPVDYITKTLGTAYKAAADCPLFKKSILQWCCGSTELVRFLQVWSGYCLSGLTEFQGLLFLYGGGRNGKSVFTNVLTQLTGDYAQMMPSECLMARDGSASNDVARLVGKRFVTAVELPENKVMDENKIKQLTGGDRITARALYKDYIEFNPVLKLTISGNHKPIIRGNDQGIWRRINLVPFNAQISEDEVDVDLPRKLSEEMSGILNWAIEGFKIYQQEGLIVPQCVKDESLNYRSEMDIIGQWMAECIETVQGGQVKAADMYSSFKTWAINNGFHQMNSTSFGRTMSDRLETKKTSSGKCYLGIDLKTFDIEKFEDVKF